MTATVAKVRKYSASRSRVERFIGKLLSPRDAVILLFKLCVSKRIFMDSFILNSTFNVCTGVE